MAKRQRHSRSIALAVPRRMTTEMQEGDTVILFSANSKFNSVVLNADRSPRRSSWERETFSIGKRASSEF